MKFFLDTEFHEFHKQPKCLGFKIGKAIPTVDLISVGIVDENDHTLSLISKDFDIKAAWDSTQLDEGVEIHWLRYNVLLPIFQELRIAYNQTNHVIIDELHFELGVFKNLIEIYGKTNKQIADQIKMFTLPDGKLNKHGYLDDPEFYAYFADYDWVVIAQLFGKMMNLPEGFPFYCRDLKQSFDMTASKLFFKANPKSAQMQLKASQMYPIQTTGLHVALEDAKWNKKLYTFLNKFHKEEL